MKKLYVGNLPDSATDERLRELFEQWGQVVTAQVIVDRATGRNRGFGFVHMSSGADAAIEHVPEIEWDGRVLRVSEARETPNSHPHRDDW